MSLSKLYADYVTKAERERDPLRLYVTDVGKCPRMVAYRMLETEKNPVSEQHMTNKLIMFDLADYICETLYGALCDAEKSIAYEMNVDIYDRRNWGGRFDIIADYGGVRIIEVKTVHPNAFRHGLEYPEHHHQAAIYDHYCKELYRLEAPPLIPYFDRGGQNTPVEQVSESTYEQFAPLMDELDETRVKLPLLPDKLPKVLKERNYCRDIIHEPDYRCDRCDYTVACLPSLSTSRWAKRDNVKQPYEPTPKAKPDILLPFIETLKKG